MLLKTQALFASSLCKSLREWSLSKLSPSLSRSLQVVSVQDLHGSFPAQVLCASSQRKLLHESQCKFLCESFQCKFVCASSLCKFSVQHAQVLAASFCPAFSTQIAWRQHLGGLRISIFELRESTPHTEVALFKLEQEPHAPFPQRNRRKKSKAHSF